MTRRSWIEKSVQNVFNVYQILLRQADVGEQGLIAAQRVQLVADVGHVPHQVTHRNVAEDAQQDLVGQIRHPHRGGGYGVLVEHSLRQTSNRVRPLCVFHAEN